MKNKLLSLLFITVFFYLFICQITAVWAFTIDDMYIPLRYAKHWVEGYGLVWNLNQSPVEGYSNFSFVVLGAFALKFGIDPVWLLKITGILGLLGTCLAIFWITRFWFNAYLACVPVFWLLLYKGQILWTVSGLETTVYQAFIGFGVFFAIQGLGYSLYPGNRKEISRINWFLSAIFLSLAGLTRPEAFCFMALVFGLLLIDKPYEEKWTTYTQSLALFCGVITLLYLPYFIWRWHYFGLLFPNSVYCKGITTGQNFYLDKEYLKLIWPLILLALFAFKNLEKRYLFLCLPSLMYLLLLASADPIVAFDNRLFLPAFMLLLPLSFQGLSCLVEIYFNKKEAYYSIAVIVLAFWIGILFIPKMTLPDYKQFTNNPIAGETLRMQVVEWLNQYSKPEDEIVLGDSGLIPYKTGRNFVDSYCLNNAVMAQYPESRRYLQFCKSIFTSKPAFFILTSLEDKNSTVYEPADVCLKQELAINKGYVFMKDFISYEGLSIYRYSLYKRVDL